MNRRNFLLSLGGIAVCGPEVLGRLAWKRTMFPGAAFVRPLGIEAQITQAFWDHKARTGAYPTHIVVPPKTAMELASTLIGQRHPAPVMTYMGAQLVPDPYTPHETIVLRHIGPGDSPPPPNWLPPAGQLYMQYVTERRLIR